MFNIKDQLNKILGANNIKASKTESEKKFSELIVDFLDAAKKIEEGIDNTVNKESARLLLCRPIGETVGELNSMITFRGNALDLAIKVRDHAAKEGLEDIVKALNEKLIKADQLPLETVRDMCEEFLPVLVALHFDTKPIMLLIEQCDYFIAKYNM